jgi:hypothetical protein
MALNNMQALENPLVNSFEPAMLSIGKEAQVQWTTRFRSCQ